MDGSDEKLVSASVALTVSRGSDSQGQCFSPVVSYDAPDNRTSKERFLRDGDRYWFREKLVYASIKRVCPDHVDFPSCMRRAFESRLPQPGPPL